MTHDYWGEKEPIQIKYHEIRAGDMIVVETWVTVQEGSRTREIRTKTTGVADYQDYNNITWFTPYTLCRYIVPTSFFSFTGRSSSTVADIVLFGLYKTV